jgi:hypothetical protein
MKLPVYIVDAFTDKLFGGNPAAICPLHEWLPDKLMQSLAAENNLSETGICYRRRRPLPDPLVHARHRSKALRTCNAGECSHFLYRAESYEKRGLV